MLFATSTDLYAGLGFISNKLFDDVWPFLIVLIGIILAFWIIEVLIDAVRLGVEKKRGIGLFDASENRTEISKNEYAYKEWLYKI